MTSWWHRWYKLHHSVALYPLKKGLTTTWMLTPVLTIFFVNQVLAKNIWSKQFTTCYLTFFYVIYGYHSCAYLAVKQRHKCLCLVKIHKRTVGRVWYPVEHPVGSGCFCSSFILIYIYVYICTVYIWILSVEVGDHMRRSLFFPVNSESYRTSPEVVGRLYDSSRPFILFSSVVHEVDWLSLTRSRKCCTH